ncbi:hypothetical protein [Mycolicibacterium sp.]|jgi:hypothetical protein|uniref:hypothetical protein n=1 Tax=Mycolicibacterium sp. TaxID=2320850 RepID=UPI0028AF1485|nr:hypothetical protein [Mycolicibacterium sp.]
MKPTTRRLLPAVSAVALGGLGFAVQTVEPVGGARADTCVQVGNQANVSTCADLTDVVGEIMTPGRPDRGPGNLTPNMYSCLGWDGQWVNADSCT